ncbi:MAG: tyrosine-type recombinase/integrase [Dermatophilaceae bacterium]
MTTPDWLAYLHGRNRSPATIASYRSVMAQYEATVGDPLTATVDDAQRWWERLDRLTPAARARSLSVVRSYYTWAMRHDLLHATPLRRLDAPSLGHRLPHPVNRADWLTILERTEGDLRRAVCLGAYAGLRVAEAAHLHWRDIDTDARRIMVRSGKGDKDRVVGLSVLLMDELLPNTGANVVTGTEHELSANALQQRVNRHLRELGIDGTFHKLRARFATQALAHTGNLLAVSRALGHSSPSVTARYAATSDSDLDLIAEAATR